AVREHAKYIEAGENDNHKGTPSTDWHRACPAQLELVSTSRGGVRCLTGVRPKTTFNGLALGLPRSARAPKHLQRGCEVFDRCPTKAHLQGTGTGLAPLSWSSLAPPEGGACLCMWSHTRHT